MLTIDAQLAVTALFAAMPEPPAHWHHDLRGGRLTYAFAGSPNTFTWRAEDVADMARRPYLAELVPELDRRLCDALRRCLELTEQADLSPPDEAWIDLVAADVTLLWHEVKLALIVEADGRFDPVAAGVPGAR